MGITAFIVEPGAASTSDLKIMFTDSKTVRDYVVVFSTNPDDQASGVFGGRPKSGLIARPDADGPPWQPDLSKAAEDLNENLDPYRHDSDFKPTSLAVKLDALSDEVQTYRRNDPRMRESRENSLPIDIVMVLKHRLHTIDGDAISTPFCVSQDLEHRGDLKMLDDARTAFQGLQKVVERLGRTPEIRVLIGPTVDARAVADKDELWQNVDVYNLVNALGIEPTGAGSVSVAQFNPVCGVAEASMRPKDLGPKRFFALDTMAHIKACDPSTRPAGVVLPDLSCSQANDENVDFAMVMPPLPVEPRPRGWVSPPRPDSDPPDPNWSVTYGTAPDAPASRSVALVEQVGASEHATIDFVEILPGHTENPKTAPGKPSVNLPPNARPASGQHAVFVRIKPDPSACRDGQTIRADISIAGSAFTAGTQPRMSVTQKAFACELVTIPVATFTIR